MDYFKENLATIGEVFDKETEVEEELDEIEDAISELKEEAEASDKNSLIILANDDKISAYGPNSRFGLIHDVFGVPAVDDTIEASTHGMNVSFEYVTEQDPDLLYVIDRSAVVDGESSAKQVVENKLMEKTKAYKNADIIYLDPNYWYLSGGGLESVSEMIDEVSESLKEKRENDETTHSEWVVFCSKIKCAKSKGEVHSFVMEMLITATFTAKSRVRQVL